MCTHNMVFYSKGKALLFILWSSIPVHWLLIFFRAEQDIVLPEPGKYATGMMFIEAREQDEVRTEFTKMATQMQLEVSSRVI